MVSLESVVFSYPGGEFRLEIPSLSVTPGEQVAVVGPSGSGKTTLLHLVAGIVVPLSGRVEVGGTELSALGDAQRRAQRITRMGLVFQEFELLEYLDVLDNILLPYRISGELLLDDAARERAITLAEEVGIGDKLRRPPRRLSQGERQRVAVCRALVTEPPLVLADEPTGNLDPANRERVLTILIDYAARTSSTLLAVTHDHAVLERFGRIVDTQGWA